MRNTLTRFEEIRIINNQIKKDWDKVLRLKKECIKEWRKESKKADNKDFWLDQINGLEAFVEMLEECFI